MKSMTTAPTIGVVGIPIGMTTKNLTIESSKIAPKGAIFLCPCLKKKLDKIRKHRKESIRVSR